MERTWMPTAAGVLVIISGVLSFLMAVVWSICAVFLSETSDSLATLAFILIGVSIIVGILAIGGGAFALSRKTWGLALAGSIVALSALSLSEAAAIVVMAHPNIAALSLLLLPGIAAIVLTAQSKKAFQ